MSHIMSFVLSLGLVAGAVVPPHEPSLAEVDAFLATGPHLHTALGDATAAEARRALLNRRSSASKALLFESTKCCLCAARSDAAAMCTLETTHGRCMSACGVAHASLKPIVNRQNWAVKSHSTCDDIRQKAWGARLLASAHSCATAIANGSAAAAGGVSAKAVVAEAEAAAAKPVKESRLRGMSPYMLPASQKAKHAAKKAAAGTAAKGAAGGTNTSDAECWLACTGSSRASRAFPNLANASALYPPFASSSNPLVKTDVSWGAYRTFRRAMERNQCLSYTTSGGEDLEDVNVFSRLYHHEWTSEEVTCNSAIKQYRAQVGVYGILSLLEREFAYMQYPHGTADGLDEVGGLANGTVEETYSSVDGQSGFVAEDWAHYIGEMAADWAIEEGNPAWALEAVMINKLDHHSIHGVIWRPISRLQSLANNAVWGVATQMASGMTDAGVDICALDVAAFKDVCHGVGHGLAFFVDGTSRPESQWHSVPYLASQCMTHADSRCASFCIHGLFHEISAASLADVYRPAQENNTAKAAARAASRSQQWAADVYAALPDKTVAESSSDSYEDYADLVEALVDCTSLGESHPYSCYLTQVVSDADDVDLDVVSLCYTALASAGIVQQAGCAAAFGAATIKAEMPPPSPPPSSEAESSTGCVSPVSKLEGFWRSDDLQSMTCVAHQELCSSLWSHSYSLYLSCTAGWSYFMAFFVFSVGGYAPTYQPWLLTEYIEPACESMWSDELAQLTCVAQLFDFASIMSPLTTDTAWLHAFGTLSLDTAQAAPSTYAHAIAARETQLTKWRNYVTGLRNRTGISDCTLNNLLS